MILPEVGTSWAEYFNWPEVFGLNEHVAVWAPETSTVNLPIHPGIRFVPAKKVTFPAALVVAVNVVALLFNCAPVTTGALIVLVVTDVPTNI